MPSPLAKRIAEKWYQYGPTHGLRDELAQLIDSELEQVRMQLRNAQERFMMGWSSPDSDATTPYCETLKQLEKE